MKRKKSLENNDQSDGDLPASKKKKHFSGLSFRQKITGDESLQAMKAFLEIYREGTSEQDIVLEYLESGGNGEEILLLLPSENKDPETVICVFNVLECIFLRVMTDLTSYLPEMEETAKCLLQSHLPVVYLLLSAKSSFGSKKAVLRLLTVMSTLSGKVAKNILTCLKISSSVMYGLTRHDSASRPLFIHFVLSFIVEGNPHVVKLLLDKKDYLRCIIHGLVYDSEETVEMVLAALQKNVLENPLINKTTKMHAFNSNVLKSFFDLFDWKGPQKVQKKKKHISKTSEVSHYEVDVDKKANVQEALYSFLSILCSSMKSGVIFLDPTLGVSGKNQNLLVHKVLEALEKPWEHAVLARLLVKIFAACPDLIPCATHHMAPHLEPRMSHKWFEAMDFFGKVIDSAEPGIYLSKPGALLQGQLLSALERLLIPRAVIQAIAGSSLVEESAAFVSALFHPEILVRHKAVGILNKIVKCALRFLEYEGLYHYFSSTSRADQFRQSFLNLLSKTLPSVGSLFKIWKQALGNVNGCKEMNVNPKDTYSECPFSATSHLQGILELLLAYAKWWPPLDMKVDVDDVEDGWGLLKSKNFLKDIQQFKELELMALGLLSATGSLILSADQNNKEILCHLLHSYAKEEEKKCCKSWKNLILTLLLKTGHFEGNEVEACIWLHCFRIWYQEKLKKVGGIMINLKEANVLADFIALSLNELINSSEQYKKVSSELFCSKIHMQGINSGEQKFKSITQIFNDMMEEGYDIGEPLESTHGWQPNFGFTVSPLLPAALSQAENYVTRTEEIDVINCYLGKVIIHILFGQSSPKPLLHLLKGRVSSYSPPKSVLKYIKSWSTQTPRKIGNLLGSECVFSHYSNCLLDGLESGENIPSNVGMSSLDISDGVDITLLFRMIIFHVVNMAQQRCLIEETRIMAENILEQLIQHSSLFDDEENLFLVESKGKWRDLFSYCLTSVFNNSVILELFKPLGGSEETHRQVTQLVEQCLHFKKYLPENKSYCDAIDFYFKNKFFQCIYDALVDLSEQKEGTLEWDLGTVDALFVALTFSAEKVINLLKRISIVPAESLVDSQSWNLSGPGLSTVRLMQQLCQLKMNSVKMTLDAQVFSAVADHLAILEEMFESSSTDGLGNALTQLEECVLDFLRVFPHLISSFPKRLFLCLISSKFTRESACKLSNFMISNCEAFLTLFLEQCDSNWKMVSLQFGRVLSHLTCILCIKEESIPDSILTLIYEAQRVALRNDFSNSLELPIWISENPQLFRLLVMKVMDDKTCYHFYHQLNTGLENGVTTRIALLEVLFPVYEKLEKSSCFKLKEDPRVSFIKLMLHSFICTVKSATKNEKHPKNGDAQSSETDIEKFSHLMCNLIEKTNDCGSNLNWRLVKKGNAWKEFLQLALKIGIGQANSFILKSLERLCSKVLSADDPDAVVLYKMTILHSKFLEIMLENKASKVEIMELLLTLIEKNCANMSSSLIPILLSSYGATLRRCDILIVKVLKILDHGDLNFNQFSPFLWGNMAASFYSLKRKAKTTAFSAFSILRQPKADQVLDLLDVNQVQRTIVNFPVQRKLQAEDSFNGVYGETDVYDPCFYLPIMSHILAPENPIKIYKVVQSGALALIVAALGSADPGVRGAAMHILARFYSHLETGRPSKEKKLWLNFVDSLRNGFALLANFKDLKNASSLQLPTVVSTFLARSSLVMADPQHIMFYPLHNYFLAKPALDLDMVPEFFRLYNSCEMESRSYRYWILEVLRDGMKSELDFSACLNSGAFKVLLASFCSVTSDEKAKILILETLTAAVKTPSTAYHLVKGHGLMSWIQEVIRSSLLSTSKGPNLTRSVINLLSCLWTSLSSKSKLELRSNNERLVSSPSTPISCFMLQLFLYLLPKLLSVQLHLVDFTRFINSLLSVTEVFSKISKTQIAIIQEQDVRNAIALGKKVLKNVNVCEDALEYGHCIFPTSKELLGSFDDVSVESLTCLHKFVVIWLQMDKKTL